MHAIGDEVAHDERLVVLLGRLSDEYHHIFKIIKNMREIDLSESKAMIRREYRKEREKLR